MNTEEHIAYLNTLPLTLALWYFIENVNGDTEGRSEIFFSLRERVRNTAFPVMGEEHCEN